MKWGIHLILGTADFHETHHMLNAASPMPTAYRPADMPVGPSASEVLGQTLTALVCSVFASLAAGVTAGVIAFSVMASDGDTGDWDGLGSFLVGMFSFAAVGVLVYIVATIAGLIRFVAPGHRTIPALFLTSPFWLGLLAVVAGSF